MIDKRAEPIDTSRVDFDALYELGGVILDPVPDENKYMYRYWRGASLAKIVINFARGHEVLNAGRDLTMHFTSNWSRAYSIASEILSVVRPFQLTGEDRRDLAAATGKDPNAPLPNIVFALATDTNSLYLGPAYHGDEQDFDFRGYVSLQSIDPYSKEIISGLVEK